MEQPDEVLEEDPAGCFVALLCLVDAEHSAHVIVSTFALGLAELDHGLLVGTRPYCAALGRDMV